jgi:membrane associated rhomboid family serine protease
MGNENWPAESQTLEVDETEDIREVELPRWIQVPVGIILNLFTLLCGFASAYLLFVPNKTAPILGLVVGVVLLLGCLWVLGKCWRLITGKKTRGGFMSPTALRVVSVFLLVLPAVGLFTGYYRDMGAVAIGQVVIYFFGSFGLRALARKREAQREAESPDAENHQVEA